MRENTDQKNSEYGHFSRSSNVNKILKSILPNITFTLNVLSENGIIFVWMSFFLTPKIMLILQKRGFLKGIRERMRKYEEIYYALSVSCMVQHIYIFILS